MFALLDSAMATDKMVISQIRNSLSIFAEERIWFRFVFGITIWGIYEWNIEKFNRSKIFFAGFIRKNIVLFLV